MQRKTQNNNRNEFWNKVRDNKNKIIEFTQEIDDLSSRTILLNLEIKNAREKMIEYKDNVKCIKAYKRVELTAIHAVQILSESKNYMKNRLVTL